MSSGLLISVCLVMAPLLTATTPDDRKALERIEARLEQEPSNPRLWAARGIALARLGRDRESLDSFDKALAISTKFLGALAGAAEVAYRSKDSRAGTYVTRILEQDANNVTANAMAGTLAFEARDCRATVDHFRLAATAVNQSPGALAQWGECLLALDQPAPAAAKLRESLERLPGDKRIQFNLALALHLSGKQDVALVMLRQLPEDSGALNLQAEIYVSQNRFKDAVASFQKAIAFAPRDERNYIDLASLCLEHQSFDVAYDVVNAGIAAIPDSAALYTLRGAIAAQGAKMEQAAADFERASRLQPDQIYSDAGLSLLLQQKDEIDKAISVIRPRLISSPEDPALNFLLADLLLKRPDLTPGQRAEAKALLIHATRLKPDLAKARSVLGKLEIQSGEIEEGVRELRTALRYAPSDRIALNQLVLGLRKLGRADEAAAIASRLRDLLAEGRRDEVRKNSVRFIRRDSQRP